MTPFLLKIAKKCSLIYHENTKIAFYSKIQAEKILKRSCLKQQVEYKKKNKLFKTTKSFVFLSTSN